MRRARVDDEAADGLIDAVVRWYGREHRELPWRDPGCSPWGVLVSEVMLQQTPVVRVLPVWTAWLDQWPEPGALATEAPGAAVAAWGRLGYPRRALRLHAAATVCVDRFDGAVPDSYVDLRRLPGVGDYTAAAVAAFAFRQRQVVLDTNVRRVLARVAEGAAFEPSGAPAAVERARAEAFLPHDAEASAVWNVAIMELGALVCTARAPRCTSCPVADLCRWRLAGSPAWDGPPRRGQTYEGTDRQVRGRLLAVLRDAVGEVSTSALDEIGGDPVQRARALDSLVADGLVEPCGSDSFRLPGRAG